MKNALFWALVAVVAVILGLLGYGIYLSVTSASPGFDLATALCSGFILVAALVAWEVLMKPGYYRHREETKRGTTGDEDEGAPPPPRSR